MVSVFNPHEIYLFGNYYPILKEVKETLRPSFGQKMVFGDYTKDSELDVSSLVFSDNRAGIGIKDMNEQKDVGRCWWSTCEIGFKGHLTLPPLAVDCGNPTATYDTPNLGVEYNNQNYAVFGTTVYVWNDGTKSWGTSIHTLMAVPTSAVVHNGYLFFACGTDFERYDGTNWTDGETLSIQKSGFTNILTNADMETWSSGASSPPDDWNVFNCSAAREGTIIHGGTYSAKITASAGTPGFYQSIASYATLVGLAVSFGAWVRSGVANSARLLIYDGVNLNYSSYCPDDNEFHWLSVKTTVSNSATLLRGYLVLPPGSDDAYIDDAILGVGNPQPSLFFLNWDNKLLRLDNTGQLSYSVDDGITWTNNAKSNLETGFFKSLTLYRDSTSNILPYLGTKQGVYALDFDNAVWQETGLQFPRHDYACNGMVLWRDGLFVPVGSGVYQYMTSSSPVSITPMGPDRDYGLPQEYRGNIIQMLNEHNALYAILNNTSEVPRDLFASAYSWDSVIYDDAGYSAVMKWNTAGWSIVKMSGDADAPATYALVSNADNQYRLWFGMNKKVFYIPLNVNLQNPLELPDYNYDSTAEHIWGWFDADNAVVDKIALSISVYAEHATADEYIMVYYGLDYDDNTWTLLTNTTHTDGKIDADGEAKFTLGSEDGINFKAMRFKAVLYRGSDTTKSPDLRWLKLEYMKITDARWSYTVLVDCTRDYKHKRQSTLVDALKTAADNKTLGDFVYRTFAGTSETKKVKIQSMTGVEKGGQVKEGQFSLVLLAP
jgi:hypothetical protein